MEGTIVRIGFAVSDNGRKTFSRDRISESASGTRPKGSKVNVDKEVSRSRSMGRSTELQAKHRFNQVARGDGEEVSGEGPRIYRRVVEDVLPESDGLLSPVSVRSVASEFDQTIEARNREALRKGKGKMVESEKTKEIVLEPRPLRAVKLGEPRSEVVKGAYISRGGRKDSVVKDVVMRGEEERSRTGKKVKLERVESDDEESLALKRQRLIEGKLRRSKKELKALLGGKSPEAGLLETTRASKGIASRIGERSTRSRMGNKSKSVKPVRIVMVDSDSEEDSEAKKKTNSEIVVHEGNGTNGYVSDDRVSSRDFDDDDLLVEETQAIVVARRVDAQVLRDVGQQLGLTKAQLNRGKLKEVINKVVEEAEEGGDRFGTEEEFLGETEEERMYGEDRVAWSDEESGFGDDSFEDE